MDLATKLRVARISIKASTKDVAKKLGCSTQYINNLERKATENKILIQYFCLLRRNGVDMNKFFDFENENN